MVPELDEEWISLIWDHSVIPYLEEQFFGQEDEIKQYALERLKGEAVGDGLVEENAPEAD